MEHMTLFHGWYIDAPVCIEYARSFRKTIWAAVFLAECRCFCCAKMVRGAAHTEIMQQRKYQQSVTNPAVLVVYMGGIKRRSNVRLSRRRMPGLRA